MCEAQRPRNRYDWSYVLDYIERMNNGVTGRSEALLERGSKYFILHVGRPSDRVVPLAKPADTRRTRRIPPK